jgi:hypothetical protein
METSLSALSATGEVIAGFGVPFTLGDVEDGVDGLVVDPQGRVLVLGDIAANVNGPVPYLARVLIR